LTFLSVGISYQTASFVDLELATMSDGPITDGLARLMSAPAVSEAVLLRTCNRSEAYTWVNDAQIGAFEVCGALERMWGVPRGWSDTRSHVLSGERAVRPLFLVAAGLESMVAGETQIQGQVREAYLTAHETGAAGRNLHLIFRMALEAGKRARASSGLDAARRSIPRSGVSALSDLLGGLDGRHVIVVGAGKMAAASLEALATTGATTQIAARRPDVVGESLLSAGTCPVVPIDELEKALLSADAVIFATTAPHVLMRREWVETLMDERRLDPLAVLDLGMPPNVDPDTKEVPGVDVVDLESLQSSGYTSTKGWEDELGRARRSVAAEATECVRRVRSRASDDFASKVQALASAVVSEETARVLRKMPELDTRCQEMISIGMNRAMRKLLHGPISRGAEAAANGDAHALEVARWLFKIDDDPVDSEPASAL
jgi:glutamyl-tRNA reductase